MKYILDINAVLSSRLGRAFVRSEFMAASLSPRSLRRSCACHSSVSRPTARGVRLRGRLSNPSILRSARRPGWRGSPQLPVLAPALNQSVMPYLSFNDFLTNSASKMMPEASGLSLKHIMVFVVLGLLMVSVSPPYVVVVAEP